MAMSIDVPTEPLHEPVASSDTALSCLIRFAERRGHDAEIEALRRRAVLGGNTLPASSLVKLVGEFGLHARCTRLDWQGLTPDVFGYPILVFLKNTNVVAVIGGGAGSEAVSVWDPLHSEDEALSVPRQEFERAWSGYALIIAQQPSAAAQLPAMPAEEPGPESPYAPPERSSRRARILNEPPLPCPAPVSRPAKSLGLVAIGLVAAVSVGILLLLRTAGDNDAAIGTKSGGSDQRVAGSTISTAETIAHPAAEPPAASTRTEPVEEAAGGNVSPAPPQPPSGPASAVATALGAMPPAVDLAAAVQAAPPELAPVVATAPVAATPTANPTATLSPAAAISVEPHLFADEINALVARGDALFGKGDLAAARLFYERAADAGEGRAAVRLGETFDPVFLDHAHLRGVRGDPQTALSWYRRARDLGAVDAEVLLNSLEANLER